MNQATNITSKRNGTMGKKRVEIMSLTAMEASSINSMAILIRVLMKQSSNRTISRVSPPISMNINHV